MKIKVIKGKIGDNGIGKILDLDNAEAERLIRLGYAEKTGAASTQTPPNPQPELSGGEKKK